MTPDSFTQGLRVHPGMLSGSAAHLPALGKCQSGANPYSDYVCPPAFRNSPDERPRPRLTPATHMCNARCYRFREAARHSWRTAADSQRMLGETTAAVTHERKPRLSVTACSSLLPVREMMSAITFGCGLTSRSRRPKGFSRFELPSYRPLHSSRSTSCSAPSPESHVHARS